MPQSGQDGSLVYLNGIAIGSGLQVITTSGIIQDPFSPNVIVTYDQPQFDWQGQNQTVDKFPEFLFYGGDVIYTKDKAGNVIVGNKDKPFGAT